MLSTSGKPVILIRSYHKTTPIGAQLTVSYEPVDIKGKVYLFAEVSHQTGLRDGGFTTTLVDEEDEEGWIEMSETMNWMFHNEVMKVMWTELDGFSGVLRLPETLRAWVGGITIKPY